MSSENVALLYPIFLGVWVLLTLLSAGFLFFNKNAALKRRIWPAFVISIGVLFLVFTAARGTPPQSLLVIAPVIALITFLNLRLIKFCDACGATITRQSRSAKSASCPKCGAKLQ